jgi:hypothetical protein
LYFGISDWFSSKKSSIFELTADLNPAINDEMDLGKRTGEWRFISRNWWSFDR